MPKKITFIFFLVFLSANLFGQTPGLEFDYSQFKYNTNYNLVELYYSIDPNTLTSSSRDSLSIVEPVLSVKAKDITGDSLIIEKDYYNEHEYENENRNLIIGTLKFVLPAGKYLLSLSLTDKNKPGITTTLTDSLKVTLIDSTKFDLSPIELAADIRKAAPGEEGSSFEKNSLIVIPNPAGTYTSDNPLLKYYAEIYNINSVTDTSLLLETRLVNANANIVYSKSESVSSDQNDIVEIGQINMLRYPSGIYNLQLILTDPSVKAVKSSQKRFFLYNKLFTGGDENNSGSENKDKYLSSIFATLSETEVDLLFSQAKYIALDKEMEQYEKLSDEASKQKFIYEFFQKRDVTPGDNYNEFYFDYLKRVEEANNRFGSLGRDGYKTDRGRVLLQYGLPDRIDKFPNESNLKPYELWYYDGLEGGVVFVFGDTSGFGNYELLHSTKRGEVYDESWQRRLRVD